METCAITIVMDENGDWHVAKLEDAGDIAADLGAEGGTMMRRVDLTVRMSHPKMTNVALDVPDEAGATAAAEVA